MVRESPICELVQVQHMPDQIRPRDQKNLLRQEVVTELLSRKERLKLNKSARFDYTVILLASTPDPVLQCDFPLCPISPLYR